MRTAVVWAILLLPGCTSETTQPDGVVDGWTEATSPLWLVRSTGCGFCSGDPDVAEFEGVLYYRGGQAASFTYALGRAGDPAVTAVPAAEPWIPLFEEVLDQASLYAQSGSRGIRLHAVTTGTLSDDAERDVRRGLLDALRDARDPVEKDGAECADCAHVVLQSFGDPVAARIEDRYNNDIGDGWRRVDAQMVAIRDWLAP